MNGLLFSYFLGSDTFHVALKYGIFSEWSLSGFLFFLAIYSFAICFLCALIFTMKGKASKEETRLSKGVMLKRTVQLYSLVQAAFLGLSFMLMISFQLYTFWGSRLLCLVLLLNLLVPVIAMSFFGTKHDKKHIAHPSDTDRFMMKKGGNVSFKHAK